MGVQSGKVSQAKATGKASLHSGPEGGENWTQPREEGRSSRRVSSAAVAVSQAAWPR